MVGNRLFALDSSSESVLAFNFDAVHSNFSQLATYRLPSTSSASNLAVSPDGALIYLPIGNPDMIAVLDANLLASNQPPLITNIATGILPYQIAVSPLPANQVGVHHNIQLNQNSQLSSAVDSSLNNSSNPDESATSGVHGRPVTREQQQPTGEVRRALRY